MQNEIVIEIGPKGSGKTHKACQLIEEMERVVIFDMIAEGAYEETIIPDPERTEPPNKSNNRIVRGSIKELAQTISRDKDQFQVIYRPTVIEMKEHGIVDVPEFGPVTKLVYLRGDCWYVIDEAHILTDSYNCPKELMIANLLGRHRNMSMLLVSQSFTGIHPKIRRNADTFYFWRIIEPSDLDAIRKRCGRETEEKVEQLRVLERDRDTGKIIQTGQYLRWDKLKGITEVSE